MASAAAAKAARRRAAAAPSMTLWSTLSVANKLVRILNVRVSVRRHAWYCTSHGEQARLAEGDDARELVDT